MSFVIEFIDLIT